MSGTFTRYGNLFFEWAPIRFLDTTALKVWQVIYNKADIPGLWQVDLAEVASKAFLSNEQTMRSLDELRDKELAEFDRQNRMLRLTQFPDAGEWPTSPKIMRSWWKLFTSRMPDCDVRNAHVPLLRWLLDEGARESKHPNATGRPSDLHEAIWNETFGRVQAPTGRPTNPRSFADADTSTPKQPSLFGIRGGVAGSDGSDGIPARIGSRLGSDWDPCPLTALPSDTINTEQFQPPSSTIGSDPDHDLDRITDPYGDGDGDGDGVGAGVGSTSGSGSRLAQVIVLDPKSMSRAKPVGPTLVEQQRDRQVSLIIRTIHHEHVQAFLRARTAIGSRAPGPAISDIPRELSDLVHSFGDLTDAMERCRYALEIRELEATILKRSLQFFGHSMWKPANFEKALTLDPAEIHAQAAALPASPRPASRPGDPTRTSALGAANAYFDRLSGNDPHRR